MALHNFIILKRKKNPQVGDHIVRYLFINE